MAKEFVRVGYLGRRLRGQGVTQGGPTSHWQGGGQGVNLKGSGGEGPRPRAAAGWVRSGVCEVGCELESAHCAARGCSRVATLPRADGTVTLVTAITGTVFTGRIYRHLHRRLHGEGSACDTNGIPTGSCVSSGPLPEALSLRVPCHSGDAVSDARS